MFERFTAKWKEYMNPIPHKESYEKLLHALLIIQISKGDYIDFPDFSMHLVSV
jgi:hypothetical protein